MSEQPNQHKERKEEIEHHILTAKENLKTAMYLCTDPETTKPTLEFQWVHALLIASLSNLDNIIKEIELV